LLGPLLLILPDSSRAVPVKDEASKANKLRMLSGQVDSPRILLRFLVLISGRRLPFKLSKSDFHSNFVDLINGFGRFGIGYRFRRAVAAVFIDTRGSSTSLELVQVNEYCHGNKLMLAKRNSAINLWKWKEKSKHFPSCCSFPSLLFDFTSMYVHAKGKPQ